MTITDKPTQVLWMGLQQPPAAALDAAHATGYRDGLEAAAVSIYCGCQNAQAVVALGKPNSAERWRLCGEANCMALEVAAIRAMKEDTP